MEGRIIKMAYAKPKKKKIPPPMPSKEITFNLYVENLSYEVRAKDLKEFFTSEGTDIVNAEVVFEGIPRRSAGYAFVSFKSKKEAEAALAAFHGKVILLEKCAESFEFAFFNQGIPYEDLKFSIALPIGFADDHLELKKFTQKFLFCSCLWEEKFVWHVVNNLLKYQ